MRAARFRLPDLPASHKALAGFFTLSFLINGTLRFGRFSGDALIHFTVAERLSNGHWFQFNPAEVSSPTTSIAWTVFEAALFHLVGLGGLTTCIPIMVTAALLGTAVLIFRLSIELGASKRASIVGALSFLAIPGITYNAMVGMENIVFALLLLHCLRLYARWSVHREKHSLQRDAILGLLFGIAPLLRPEGVVVLGLGLRPLLAGEKRILRVLAIALACALPWVVAHHSLTGAWLPGSGWSRLMAARRETSSIRIIGSFWIYGGCALRLLTYWPLPLLAWFGSRPREGQSELTGTLRRSSLDLVTLGLLLYTFLSGNPHIARTTTWLFSLLCALAPSGWGRVSKTLDSRRFVACAVALSIWFGGVVSLETVARTIRWMRPGYSRNEVIERYNKRSQATDRLLSEICGGGCCTAGNPPAIAINEAQLRFFTDDRVLIRSFDGRTAPRISGTLSMPFDADGCPDFDAVLNDPKVVAVLEDPLDSMPQCKGSKLANQLDDAWKDRSPSLPGWTWNSHIEGYVRTCNDL